MKADDNGLNLYTLQCQNHILNPLREQFGIDTSDAAIRKAVEEHNRVCELIRQIGEYRKEDHPRLTGYEFHILTMATYVAPKDLLIEKLTETLEELKTRKPEEKNPYRIRVVLVGSEVDDVDLVRLIEDCGAYVCADRFCYGVYFPAGHHRVKGRRGCTDPDLPAVHVPGTVCQIYESGEDSGTA